MTVKQNDQWDPRRARTGDAIGWTFMLGTEGIETERLGRDNLVIRAVVDRHAGTNQVSCAEREMRVERCRVATGMRLVQLTASAFPVFVDRARGIAAAEESVEERPWLIDRAGTKFPAVGYLCATGSCIDFRYTPDEPLTSVRDVPRWPRNEDVGVHLTFAVPETVPIVAFGVGNTMVAEFEPELK